MDRVPKATDRYVIVGGRLVLRKAGHYQFTEDHQKSVVDNLITMVPYQEAVRLFKEDFTSPG